MGMNSHIFIMLVVNALRPSGQKRYESCESLLASPASRFMIASTQTNQPFAGAGSRAGGDYMQRAINRLRAASMRVTRSRLKLLEALSSGVPMSIEELYEAAGQQNCDIVTVYRGMVAFEQVGIVRRSFRHDGALLFECDLGRPPQYRINCKATGEIHIMDVNTTRKLRAAIESAEEILRARGFHDVTHRLEFSAVCPMRKPRQRESQPRSQQSAESPAVRSRS